MSGDYPSRDAVARWVPDGSWALARDQALAMHDEIDRLRDELELVTDDFRVLCAQVGHVECKCVIPCHMGCLRCDMDTSGAQS